MLEITLIQLRSEPFKLELDESIRILRELHAIKGHCFSGASDAAAPVAPLAPPVASMTSAAATVDDVTQLADETMAEQELRVAVKNYARFHGLDPKEVGIEAVRGSCAGLRGWAAFNLPVTVVTLFASHELSEGADRTVACPEAPAEDPEASLDGDSRLSTRLRNAARTEALSGTIASSTAGCINCISLSGEVIATISATPEQSVAEFYEIVTQKLSAADEGVYELKLLGGHGTMALEETDPRAILSLLDAGAM